MSLSPAGSRPGFERDAPYAESRPSRATDPNASTSENGQGIVNPEQMPLPTPGITDKNIFFEDPADHIQSDSDSIVGELYKNGDLTKKRPAQGTSSQDSQGSQHSRVSNENHGAKLGDRRYFYNGNKKNSPALFGEHVILNSAYWALGGSDQGASLLGGATVQSSRGENPGAVASLILSAGKPYLRLWASGQFIPIGIYKKNSGSPYSEGSWELKIKGRLDARGVTEIPYEAVGGLTQILVAPTVAAQLGWCISENCALKVTLKGRASPLHGGYAVAYGQGRSTILGIFRGGAGVDVSLTVSNADMLTAGLDYDGYSNLVRGAGSAETLEGQVGWMRVFDQKTKIKGGIQLWGVSDSTTVKQVDGPGTSDKTGRASFFGVRGIVEW